MSTESVHTPFTVGLLWHFLFFRITTFGDSCWVFSTLGCTLCTGLSLVCPHIVLIVEFEMIARGPEWQHIPMGVTIDVSDERLARLI